jgi:hypothetical protein
MIHSLLEYSGVIIDGSPDIHIKRLENIQRQAALACTGAYRHTNHEKLLGWPSLK